jgi:virginiamycin B lyase
MTESPRRAFPPLLLAAVLAAAPARAVEPPPGKPGVPSVQVPFANLKPEAVFQIGKVADWVAITPDSVWVASSDPTSVQRIDPRTNRLVDKVALPGDPCAGIVTGFGALWVPLCGDHPGLARIDLTTHKLAGVTALPAVMAEAGLAAGGDSLWLPLDARGGLLGRVDPKTGRLRQVIVLPSGSFNPAYADGVVWVTSHDTNQVSAVDAATGAVIGAVPTGPEPRFLAAAAGAVWVLNQGDGTVTRIAARARAVTATIAQGIPGHGGDIAYGAGRVWTTTMGLPLTLTDARGGVVRRQWVGKGGDSLRYGHGSVWLTDYHGGTLARIRLAATLKP